MGRSRKQVEEKIQAMLGEIRENEELLREQIAIEAMMQQRLLRPSNATAYKIQALRKELKIVIAKWNSKYISWLEWEAEDNNICNELEMKKEQLINVEYEIADIGQKHSIELTIHSNVTKLLVYTEEMKALIKEKGLLKQRIGQLEVEKRRHELRKPIRVEELQITPKAKTQFESQHIDAVKYDNLVENTNSDSVEIVDTVMDLDVLRGEK